MVDCGPYGSNPVIRVNIIRIKHSHILIGESENVAESLSMDATHENLPDNDTKTDIDKDESQVLGKLADLPTRQFRCRRPPVLVKRL